MKCKTRSSIGIALTVLLSAMIFVPPAQGQPGRRFPDTGVVTPMTGQILRITVNMGSGNDTISVRFAWMRYMPAGCNNDGVCLHTVESQGITAPVNVGPGEAASFDVQGDGKGVRVRALVGLGSYIVNAQIINSATDEVVSHVIMANTEGDFH
ncbi:MAG TPA: hypothetical protein VGQ72_10820 [Pyrinomonadaceae bacterium]|jgi:hypothetical protein|nr:hypothetical protein [Pyrinomonadaceae bacterium]